MPFAQARRSVGGHRSSSIPEQPSRTEAPQARETRSWRRYSFFLRDASEPGAAIEALGGMALFEARKSTKKPSKKVPKRKYAASPRSLSKGT